MIFRTYVCHMGSLLASFLLLGTCLEGHAQSSVEDAQYVWLDETGEGRFQVAGFRYELELAASPEEAELHLFADSRYHLLVNGSFVNFGPGRFYPAHPQYDTYDLRPYLQAGRNVIAVKVFSNGTSSFQLRKQPACLWAAGQVAYAGKTHDLATPGDWQGMRFRGYDARAPRMTFALGPMEIYDARQDPQDWAEADGAFPGKPVVALQNQDAWGPLSPRSFPPLTQEAVRPQSLQGWYHLEQEEETLVSFRVHTPDMRAAEFRRNYPLLGYTYLYSPREQSVPVGLWWGEHYLNGEGPLKQQEDPQGRMHRQQATLNLKQGWNHFFVKRTSFWGKWDFFMAFPQSAGIELSPTKEKGSEHLFMTAGPFRPEEEERLASLDMPLSAAAAHAQFPDAWQGQPRGSSAHNPAVEMSWQYFGEQQAAPAYPSFPLALGAEHPHALVYDFRYKRLGRIVVEYEAPEGTILDVGFSEDLLGNRPYLMKRVGLYPGTRHIAREGVNRLETLKPYGLRYLQLNVRGHDAPVLIRDVRVVQQVYPFEQVGRFACSDPLMNEIWELGWRTLRVCAEDSYTDTPFRERGLYAGDMLPQMAITLAGSGDLRLVKRCLQLFQDMYVDQFYPGAERHPDEIGLLEDYPLLTLEALKWYYEWTGDTAFVAELFPAYEHLIQTQLAKRDEDGKLINQKVFIEWTQIEKKEVANTAYHALLARSCELMALLAEDLKQPTKAQAYQQEAEQLQRDLQRNFWNQTLGRYHDGIKNGQRIPHYFPMSSAWPALFGFTSAEQDQAIFPFIAEALTDIGEENRHRATTPYGGFYLLLALAQQGMAAEAEAFIRKHWSPMVYKHNDTAWENFGDQGIGTLSHAWSGGPTYYLSAQVLGVDLGFPNSFDAEQVVVAPLAETIDWAEGRIPHPRGVIDLRWELKGDVLWVDCRAPEGVQISVAPRGRLASRRIWLNGQPYQRP